MGAESKCCNACGSGESCGETDLGETEKSAAFAWGHFVADAKPEISDFWHDAIVGDVYRVATGEELPPDLVGPPNLELAGGLVQFPRCPQTFLNQPCHGESPIDDDGCPPTILDLLSMGEFK